MPSGGYIDVKLNTKRLDEMLRENPDKAAKATEIAADLVVNDIRGHWSGSSPSSPGNAPAVVSGALDASINSEKVSGGNHPVYVVTAGAEHAGYLEKGTKNMAKRPFIYPAVRRMRNKLRDVFKVHFRT